MKQEKAPSRGAGDGEDMDLSDEKCIQAVKVHFAVRRGLAIDDIKVKIIKKINDAKISRVQYLNEDKEIEWSNGLVLALYEAAKKYHFIK